MKIRPPWSRRRCTQPWRMTRSPAWLARRSPHVWVRRAGSTLQARVGGAADSVVAMAMSGGERGLAGEPAVGVLDLFERGQILGGGPGTVEGLDAAGIDDALAEALSHGVLLELDEELLGGAAMLGPRLE